MDTRHPLTVNIGKMVETKTKMLKNCIAPIKTYLKVINLHRGHKKIIYENNLLNHFLRMNTVNYTSLNFSSLSSITIKDGAYYHRGNSKAQEKSCLVIKDGTDRREFLWIDRREMREGGEPPTAVANDLLLSHFKPLLLSVSWMM